jgi:hypothetical protein
MFDLPVLVWNALPCWRGRFSCLLRYLLQNLRPELTVSSDHEQFLNMPNQVSLFHLAIGTVFSYISLENFCIDSIRERKWKKVVGI